MSLAEQTRSDGAGTKHDASIKHERSFSSCRPLTGGPHRAPGQLGPTTRPERLFTYPLSLRRFSRRLHLIAKFIIPKQVIIRRNIVRRLANFRTTFSLQVVISWSWRRSIVNLKLEEFFDSDPLVTVTLLADISARVYVRIRLLYTDSLVKYSSEYLSCLYIMFYCLVAARGRRAGKLGTNASHYLP